MPFSIECPLDPYQKHKKITIKITTSAQHAGAVAPDPQVLHLLAERDRRKPAACQLLGAAETERSAGRDR